MNGPYTKEKALSEDGAALVADRADPHADRFVWGSNLVELTVGKGRYQIFEPRRKHVAELLVDSRHWGARDYLVQGSRRLTFDGLHEAVERIAAKFQALGVTPGSRVMILAANSIDWALSYWAIARCDAVSVLGNSFWTRHEIAEAINWLKPTLVVADERRRAEMDDDVHVLPIERIEEIVASERFLPPAAPVGERSENDPAMILFTSGTSGSPKAAVLSHRSLVASAHNSFVLNGVLPHALPDDNPAHVSLIAAPLFHVGGPLHMIMAALGGNRIVLSTGRFDPVQLLELIERERVTQLPAVLTAHMRLIASPAFATADVSSVDYVWSGGMAIHPASIERLRLAYPDADIVITYGMTELGTNAVRIGGQEYRQRPTAAGRPVPTVEIRIDAPDETGLGEILVRSPANMSGYIDKPDDRTLDEDGWVHSGDLGYLDEAGFLHVSGRKKEVIIRGGENISAPHVESILVQLSEIAEVAVVGLQDPDWGEVVGAAVVFRPGQSLSIAEMEAHCKTRLPAYQIPTRWWIRDEPLPVNTTSKIAKRPVIAEWPDRVPQS